MNLRKSIISTSRKCYVCAKTQDLEVHHFIHGNGKRELADRDGLYSCLCQQCHYAVHNGDSELDELLKRLAQRKWEENYGTREQFIKRYKRSYL